MTLRCLIVFLLLAVCRLAAQVRTYAIGNSLTADSRPTPGLVGLAAARGITLDAGTHIQCGASAVSIVAFPEVTCSTLPHGTWPLALAAGGYDAVLIQTYPQGGISALEELEAWRTLATAARAGSPGCVLYLYAPWPRLPADFEADWEQDWTDPTAKVATCRGFFAWALATLREEFPGVQIVPVGDVLASLDRRLQTNPVAGLNSGLDLYRDIHHLSNLGRYAASVTVFAHVFQQDPRGLSVPAGFESAGGLHNVTITPELALMVQEAVVDVWMRQPYEPENLPTGWTVAWQPAAATVSLQTFLGTTWAVETSPNLVTWQIATLIPGDGTAQSVSVPASLPIFLRLRAH